RKKDEPALKRVIPRNPNEREPILPDAKNKEPEPKIEPGPKKENPPEPAPPAPEKVTFELLRQEKEFNNPLAVLLSADGDKVAVGGRNNNPNTSVVVRSVAEGNVLRRLADPDESFTLLAFSVDGRKLLVAVQTPKGAEARTYDLVTGAFVRFRDHEGLPATCGAYSSDGGWVVMAHGD